MQDISNITIIGRLTRTIEVNYTPGGTAIGNFSIAVNRSVKKDQQWAEEADFFDVKIIGKQAESLKAYLTKGKQVAIEGYLRQERWEKDGQKHSRVVINTNNIQLLGGKDKQDNGYGSDDNGYGYGA